MGQKVSPIGFRMGVNKTWESKWFASNKDFANFLQSDEKIRKYLSKRLKEAAVSSILINRNQKKTEVIINTAMIPKQDCFLCCITTNQERLFFLRLIRR